MILSLTLEKREGSAGKGSRPLGSENAGSFAHHDHIYC